MTLRRRRPGLVYPTNEDWHYVGEAGEPAFGTNWANGSDGAEPATSFRIRETGIVDLNLNAVNTVNLFGVRIFTLPVGYRPSRRSFTQPIYGQLTQGPATGSYIGYLHIETDGQVVIDGFKDDAGDDRDITKVVGQYMFYLVPPLATDDL